MSVADDTATGAPAIRASSYSSRLPGIRHRSMCFLERSLPQLRIGQQQLEGGVLTFEALEPLGVLSLQTTKLVTPTVIGGLGDTQLAAHRRDVLALGQQPIGRHQLAHNLLGTVPLPRRHDPVEPFCPQRGPQDSHTPGSNNR